jgi:hypothetical protein
MSTKLPTRRDVRFLLAEDIRQEAGSKSSLLGLIPGERFWVAGPPPAGAPATVAFVLPSLAFMFIITGGQGSFRGRFRIVAPDKTVVVDTPLEKTIDVVTGRPSVFATASKPFAGPGFGEYSIQLELDKTKFAFPMVIEKGRVPSKAK